MNTKTTIGLILVLAIAVICFVILDSAPNAGSSSSTINRVFKPTELPTNNVATIVVSRPGEPDAVVSLADDVWRQSAPIDYALSSYPNRPADIISAVNKLRYIERFTPGEGDYPTLEAVSLDQPAVSITLKGLRDADDGAREPFEQIIHLGTTVSGNGYLKINDDPRVYVVDDNLHNSVAKGDVKTWRESRLMDVPEPGRIRSLSLRYEDTDIEANMDNSQWRFAGSNDGRMSREAANELIGKLSNLWIESFVEDKADDLTRFGLEHHLT